MSRDNMTGFCLESQLPWTKLGIVWNLSGPSLAGLWWENLGIGRFCGSSQKLQQSLALSKTSDLRSNHHIGKPQTALLRVVAVPHSVLGASLPRKMAILSLPKAEAGQRQVSS